VLSARAEPADLPGKACPSLVLLGMSMWPGLAVVYLEADDLVAALEAIGTCGKPCDR